MTQVILLAVFLTVDTKYILTHTQALEHETILCCRLQRYFTYDGGMFYCPYVYLQMVRAVGQDTFQPKIGFKTRYGLIANPFS